MNKVAGRVDNAIRWIPYFAKLGLLTGSQDVGSCGVAQGQLSAGITTLYSDCYSIWSSPRRGSSIESSSASKDDGISDNDIGFKGLSGLMLFLRQSSFLNRSVRSSRIFIHDSQSSQTQQTYSGVPDGPVVSYRDALLRTCQKRQKSNSFVI